MARPKSRSKRPGVYSGLDRHGFRRNVRWAVDSLDYADQLPPEDRAWLREFLDEYYNAKLNTRCSNCRETPKNTRPKRTQCRNCLRLNLHNTRQLSRRVYYDNNLRNRDVYAIKGSAALLGDLDDLGPGAFNPEDTLHSTLDGTLPSLPDPQPTRSKWWHSLTQGQQRQVLSGFQDGRTDEDLAVEFRARPATLTRLRALYAAGHLRIKQE